MNESSKLEVPDQPKRDTPFITAIWKSTNTGAKVLFLGMVVFLFYLAWTTSLVPNTNSGNETIVYGQISVSPDGQLYQPESFVPKGFVSNSKAILGVILLLALVIALKAPDLTSQQLLSEREVKELIMKEFRKKKKVPLPDGKFEFKNQDFELVGDVVLRYAFLRDEVRSEFRYSCTLKAIDEDNHEEYYKVSVHPYKAMIVDIVQTDSPLKDWDRCTKCGKLFDIKYLPTDELKLMGSLRNYLGKGQPPRGNFQ